MNKYALHIETASGAVYSIDTLIQRWMRVKKGEAQISGAYARISTPREGECLEIVGSHGEEVRFLRSTTITDVSTP